MLSKKIIMLSMFLVGLLSLTTVSAVENVTTDIVSVDENACEELDIQPGEAFENSKPIADLNNTINNNSESEISLDSNYMYRNSDSAFENGIEISRDLTINGNGHWIDGVGHMRLFHVKSGNVIFKNLTLANGCTGTYGYGGAICADSYVKAVNCNFFYNEAHYGGAISNAFAENCTFEHNSADERGGAIYLDGKYYENITNCNFVENSAKTYTGLKKGIGGAVFIWNCKGVTVSGCTFVKNSGEDKGGAIVVESMNYNRVSNCIFMNNTAKGGRGSAIYWDSSDYGNVSNCIFLNNGESVIFADCSLNANNNWFGNTATNYTNKPSPCDGVIMNMWLFLNATANPDSIEVLNASNIIFDLYLYDSNSGNISKYDASLLKPIDLNITSAKGEVDKNITKLGETIKYTAKNAGTGRVTAKWENVEYSIDVCNLKLNLNLSVESREVPYSENTIITLNFNDIATGKVNITLKGKKYNLTFTDLDLNGTISLANVLVDEYNVTVVYSGDEIFLNSTAIATLKVTQARTNITADPVTTVYDNDDYLIATLKDINGNPISGVNLTVDLNGVKNYTTGENGTIRVPTKGLDAKTHTATITFKGNELYMESAKSVKIVIEKSNSTLTIYGVELDYGDSVNLTATIGGATGITAEIDGKGISVVGNVIPISGLNPGMHSLTVTTIPDGNHTAVNKTVYITVNKIKTQLIANSITATYNVNKNLVVILKDIKGNPLSGFKVVVGLNGAKTYVTDKNGQIKIAVGSLVPKTYNVKITFDGDALYLKSIKEVKVTVKKAKPKLIAKAKKFKKSLKTKKYAVTLKANTGKAIKKVKLTLKVKGKTYKAKTNAKGKATFKIKKLTKKGTFKAKITFNGNKYYSKITKQVKIKIK